MPLVSVVIRAHNPRPTYLGRALDSLRMQTLPTSQWDFLLIDNAPTSALSSARDISWHPNGRRILEKEIGVSSRRRAIKEAASDLIVFVDDDNVLDPGYLRRVVEIKADWPFLGVWGSGSIVPDFEAPPIEYVKPLVQYLSLREVASVRWSNVASPHNEATPWGPGLCVRSNVASAYLQLYEQRSLQTRRLRGQQLLSGEDVEICYVSCKIGFGIAVFPELKVTQLIPKEQITEEYLIKSFEGKSLVNLLLAFKWTGKLPPSPLSMWGMMSALKNALLRQGIDRRMYFAHVRAAMEARRIILSSKHWAVAVRTGT
jgi:glycosyltransferase involved in cell wall biosynthesis